MSRRVSWIYKIIKKYGLEAEVIDKILNENPSLDPSPLEELQELDNQADKCYLVELDCTDKQLAEFQTQLKSQLIQKQGRIDSLIFIRNDITELKELDPAEVKESVRPWLQKVNH